MEIVNKGALIDQNTTKMEDILSKFNLLDKNAKREVVDFMDFLISKKRTIRRKLLSDYKKKILSVTTWTDEELKIFDENKRLLNQWRVERW